MSNKVSKKPSLKTLAEKKDILIKDLKIKRDQKRRSKSDGGIFDDLENQAPTAQVQQMSEIQQDMLVDRIKDEIQAWVVPQVMKK